LFKKLNIPIHSENITFNESILKGLVNFEFSEEKFKKTICQIDG